MSPPSPVEQGSVTQSVAAIPIAASAAFAPFRKRSNPIDEARGWEVATHPLRQTTGDRLDTKGISSTTLCPGADVEPASNQSAIVNLFVKSELYLNVKAHVASSPLSKI